MDVSVEVAGLGHHGWWFAIEEQEHASLIATSAVEDWIFGPDELGAKFGPAGLGLGDDSAEGIVVG